MVRGKNFFIFLRRDNLKRTVFLTFVICSFQVRELSIWMPDSFWVVTCSILYSRTSQFRHFSELTTVHSFCLLSISMHLVSSIPTTMLLTQHQLLIVSDIIWSSHSTLLMLMPWADPVASSAKRFRPSSESCRGTSFMDRRKNWGPDIDSCGIPWVMSCWSNIVLVILTHWFLVSLR